MEQKIIRSFMLKSERSENAATFERALGGSKLDIIGDGHQPDSRGL